jgi:hypothetical protein
MKSAIDYLMPMRMPTSGNLIVGCFLVYIVFGLPLIVANFAPGLPRLIAPACMLAVVGVFSQMETLRSVARVLSERRMPALLWRQLMQATMARLTIAWALLSVAAMVYARGSDLHLHLPAVPAALALCAATSLLCTLAPRHVRTLLSGAVPLALVLLIARTDGTIALMKALDTLGAPALAAICLGWLGLAAALARYWSGAPGPAALAEGPSRPWFKALSVQSRRISLITVDKPSRQQANGALGSSSNWALMLNLWVFLPRLWESDLHGSVRDLIGISGMLMLIALLACSLSALDLHWRTVLAPGGWRSGGIGLRLWLCNMGTLLATVIVYETLWSALHYVVDGYWLPFVAPSVIVAGVAKLGFAVAAAVMARALPAKAGWGVLIAGGIAMVFGVAWGLTGHRDSLFDTLPAQLLYLTALVAGTVVCVMAANRLWTTERLLKATRTRLK